MATHSSFFAWKISCTEEPGGLQSKGRKESGTTEQLTLTYLVITDTKVGGVVMAGTVSSLLLICTVSHLVLTTTFQCWYY